MPQKKWIKCFKSIVSHDDELDFWDMYYFLTEASHTQKGKSSSLSKSFEKLIPLDKLVKKINNLKLKLMEDNIITSDSEINEQGYIKEVYFMSFEEKQKILRNW